MIHKRKPCARPGCPNTHQEKGIYCKVHQRKQPKREKSPYAHLYGADWQRESKRFLRGRPWCECEDCKASGNPRPANCVDHIKAHRGDTLLFWNRRNWQPMNQRCNAAKAVREEGAFGNDY